MQKRNRTSLDSDEWVTIRDFSDGEDGYPLPRYEVKYLDDVEKDHLEGELVLLKETRSTGGNGRIYQFPPEVLRNVVECLP